MAAQLPYDPRSAPVISHHVSVPRSRLTTAGFQSRRREDFAWSHFFPRSVGFGPTASSAKGAFTIAPSMLCHDQAMPSISSYSASPLRQRRDKNPFPFPFQKVFMDGTGTPKLSFRQRLPLASCSQYKDDAFKYFAGFHRLTASSGPPKIFSFFLAFSLWDERFNTVPQLVGYRP